MPLIQTDSQHYSDIADAIRDMSGNEETFYPSEMAAGVRSIPQTIAIAPIIYSLEEREVGVWTDGKPLYQKSFIVSFVSATQGAQTFTIAHGIANLDIVTYIDCNINIDNGSFAPGIQHGQYYAYVNSINSTNIYVYSTIIGNSSYPNRFAYVTILYTKTTDTPGSGTWTPSGVPAHHYSTTEQVIGTWINGKPLYEKTIKTAFAASATTLNISFDNTSREKMILSFKGTILASDNGATLHQNKQSVVFNDCYKSQVNMFTVSTITGLDYVSDGLIITRSGAGIYGIAPIVYVTIQYYKTTD